MIIKTKVLTTTDKQNLTDEQASNARTNIKAQGKLFTEDDSNIVLTDRYDEYGKYVGQTIKAAGGDEPVIYTGGTDIKVNGAEIKVDTTGTATGEHAFATGDATSATGENAVAMGTHTVANSKSQLVFGEYNIPDTAAGTAKGQYVEIVGNGTEETRKNIRTLAWNGDETIAGDLFFAYEEDKTPVSLRNLINQLKSATRFERVTELPDVGETNVIYLINDPTSAGPDTYREFIYYENTSTDPHTFEWLQIGDTTIDISGCVKTSDVDQTFNGTSVNPQSGVAIAAVISNFIKQVTTLPTGAAAGTIVQYVGDTTEDLTNGSFYRFNGTEWVELEYGRIYSEGDGISISSTNEIAVKLTTDSALKFTAAKELDDSNLKPWVGTKAELDALETTVNYKFYCTTDE